MDKHKELFKSSCKIRRKTDSKAGFAKVDSPLAKYDSAGNLSCILCRIPIKANVWKVHLNSKQHKQSVERAKQQRTEIENSTEVPKAKVPERTPEKVSIVQESIVPKDPIKFQSVDSEISAQAPLNTPSVLPEKFFDQEKSANAVGSEQEAEWAKFQREIKEAATISNIIVAEEQDNLNIKRHLKEIDEQIENWKRFIKINDKKNVLIKKERKEKKPVDLELGSSSDEDSTVDDLSNWRIKSVNK